MEAKSCRNVQSVVISSRNRSHGPRGLSRHITEIGIGIAEIAMSKNDREILTHFKLVFLAPSANSGILSLAK